MKKLRNRIILYSAILITILAINFFYFGSAPKSPEITEKSYNEFVELVKSNKVTDIGYVHIYDGQGIIEYKVKNNIYSVQITGLYFTFNNELLDILTKSKVPVSFKMMPQPFSLLGLLTKVTTYGISILLILVFVVFIRKMFYEESLVERIDEETTTFADIAGYDNTKREIAEVVAFLNDPKPYLDKGSKLPRGILLKGPPGNGKTLFAKAVAGEINAPYFQVAASKIENKWVGSGSRRLEKILQQVEKAAEKHGKAILFIDEIDAIGTDREKRTVVETNQTLNSLLTIMDGFKETNILFIAATNLDKSLDPALVRSGRFDKQILLPAPNRTNRHKIIELYLSKRSHAVDPEIYDSGFVEILASQTQGLCSSDLKELINEAGIIATAEKKDLIDITSLRKALIKLRIGIRSDVEIPEEDAELIAYHEAGHAVVQALTNKKGYMSIAYVTVEPHGESLGHVSIIPSDTVVKRISDLEHMVMVALAGRAVEERLLDGDFTTGAASDLYKANNLIATFIGKYGMSKNMQNMYLEKVDLNNPNLQKEIKKIRDDLYDRTKKLLNDNFHLVEVLAKRLIDDKHLDQQQLSEIFEDYIEA